MSELQDPSGWMTGAKQILSFVKTSVFSRQAASSKIGATPIALDFWFRSIRMARLPHFRNHSAREADSCAQSEASNMGVVKLGRVNIRAI